MARKYKVGDTVDLGEHGQGQIWASAPGNMNWHVVDENQQAHVWNERGNYSAPSRSAEFELANHRLTVNEKYDMRGGRLFSTADTGRRTVLNESDAKALARTKSPKRSRKAS